MARRWALALLWAGRKPDLCIGQVLLVETGGPSQTPNDVAQMSRKDSARSPTGICLEHPVLIPNNKGGNKPGMPTPHSRRLQQVPLHHQKNTARQLDRHNTLYNNPRNSRRRHAQSPPSSDTPHRRWHPKAIRNSHGQVFPDILASSNERKTFQV